MADAKLLGRREVDSKEQASLHVFCSSKQAWAADPRAASIDVVP